MEKKKQKNWLQWLVLTFSGILVSFTIGFLIYEIFTETQTSPNIVMTYGKIQQKEGYFALEITAKNKGTQTAEDVSIEVTSDSKNNVEKALLQFPYLPGNSSAKGWTTFTQRPDTSSLHFHVLGYSTP